MKNSILLIFFCLLGHTELLSQYTLDTSRRMSPGVWYRHYTTSSPARKIYVMEISLSEPTIQLQAVKSKDTIDAPKQTLPQMYADKDYFSRHDVTAGINSDFFTSGGPQYNPRHMMIGDGEILWDTMLNRSVFGITANRQPFISKLNENYSVTAGGNTFSIEHINRNAGGNKLVLYNRFIGNTTGAAAGGTEVKIEPIDGAGMWSANATIACRVLSKSGSGNMAYSTGQAVLHGFGTAKTFLDDMATGDTIQLSLQVLSSPSGIMNITQLTGGWTRLLQDGLNCVTASLADEGGPVPTNREPRTGIGYNEAADKIYFAVVDGRDPGVSEGMTISELADFMLYIGCYQALNLDGGGSSTIMGNNTLRNNPSDATGPRAIASSLLAYLSSITLDDFETGVGHFNRDPTYSPTTVGVSSTSVVTTALTCHSGFQGLIIKLYDNTSSSQNWVARILSGSGIPSNNRYFAGTGTISFYMKTSTANSNAKVRLWLDDNDGTELSPKLDVINDGNWHKYVWSLSDYNGTSTDEGNGTINSSGARLDAIEFSQPNTSSTWFIFIDDIMVDPDGEEETDVYGRTVVSTTVPADNPDLRESENKLEAPILLYPNPTKGELFVKLAGEVGPGFGIKVAGQSGNIVGKQEFKTNQQKIDLSQLANGLYFVTVITSQQQKTFQILINK